MVLDASGTEKIREMTIKLLDSVRRVAAHLAKLLMVRSFVAEYWIIAENLGFRTINILTFKLNNSDIQDTPLHQSVFQCRVKIMYGTIRHDAIRYDTIRYDTIRYDTMRHDATRYDTMRYDTMRYDTIRHDAIRHDTIRYDTMRHDTIRYDATRYDELTMSRSRLLSKILSCTQEQSRICIHVILQNVSHSIHCLWQGCDGDMVSLIEETEDKVELSLSILVKQVAKLAVASTVDLTEEVLADELEVRTQMSVV